MTLDLFLLSLANGRGSWVQVVVVGVGGVQVMSVIVNNQWLIVHI